MFTIDISSLKAGVHTFDVTLDAQDVELDPARFNEVRVQARLDVEASRILVTLEARVIATLECDRTLRLFDQEIGGTDYVLFAPPAFIGGVEDRFDEVRVLDPADQTLDLTKVVLDTLLLAIPQRCIAPGAEEEEIPTEFGAPDDGVDPRWEALRRLKAGSK